MPDGAAVYHFSQPRRVPFRVTSSCLGALLRTVYVLTSCLCCLLNGTYPSTSHHASVLDSASARPKPTSPMGKRGVCGSMHKARLWCLSSTVEAHKLPEILNGSNISRTAGWRIGGPRVHVYGRRMPSLRLFIRGARPASPAAAVQRWLWVAGCWRHVNLHEQMRESRGRRGDKALMKALLRTPSSSVEAARNRLGLEGRRQLALPLACLPPCPSSPRVPSRWLECCRRSPLPRALSPLPLTVHLRARKPVVI